MGYVLSSNDPVWLRADGNSCGAESLFHDHLFFHSARASCFLGKGAGELGWATVQMGLGLGGVMGSILASTWGGPKRRIHAIYGRSGRALLYDGLVLCLWADSSSVDGGHICGFLFCAVDYGQQPQYLAEQGSTSGARAGSLLPVACCIPR